MGTQDNSAMATAMMGLGDKKTLRYPFKVAADAGTFVVDKVNTCVDSSLDYSKKGMASVKKNSYVTMMSKSLDRFEKEFVTKTKPTFARAKPYIQPLVPYIDKAKPYAPPLAVAAVIVTAIPVVLTLMFLALITSPVWGFFALITSFLWVPVAIIAGLFLFTTLFFGAAVYAVRYFSKPPGRAKLLKYWKMFEKNTYVQKILYVQ